MRLVTWNVLWRFAPDWRARQTGILQVLDRLQPDVIGLQECWGAANHTQADLIATSLDMHAAYVAPSLPPVPDPPEQPDQSGIRMGVGLISRWPLSILGEHALPVSHRQIAPCALEARVHHPQTPFEVVVAATEWEPDFADDHLAQTTSLATLVKRGSSGPRFLLADLNCDASQPEFQPLTSGIMDTWELGNGNPSAVTLSGTVPFAPLEATKEIDRRIDHILVADGSRVDVRDAFTVDYPVNGMYPSDHFPVVADVELMEEPTR